MNYHNTEMWVPPTRSRDWQIPSTKNTTHTEDLWDLWKLCRRWDPFLQPLPASCIPTTTAVWSGIRYLWFQLLCSPSWAEDPPGPKTLCRKPCCKRPHLWHVCPPQTFL